MLGEYVRKCLLELKEGDYLFDDIQKQQITDNNGKPLLYAEIVELCLGVNEKSLQGAMLSIKQKIDEFARKSISALKRGDYIYDYIHGNHLKDSNGKNLGYYEKLALCGYYVDRKHTADLKADLIKEIEEYLAFGGDFHETRKSLPFDQRLHTYCKSVRGKQGIEYSPEQAMHNLGYRSYSDLYFRFLALTKLPKYRDKHGFVDAYRDDEQMRARINSLAASSKMPIAVLVELLAGENLQKHYLGIDYLRYVAQKLEEYVDENGTLDGISKKDIPLYTKVLTIRKFLSRENGEELTVEDVIDLLDVDTRGHEFRKARSEVKNLEDIMTELGVKSSEQNRKIWKKDIPAEDYRTILMRSIALGVTTKAFFKLYDIDYVDGRNVDRLKNVVVREYPYMSQMREMRDKLMEESGVSLENGFCKEEVFEKRLQVCMQVYDLFKEKIADAECHKVDNAYASTANKNGPKNSFETGRDKQ